MHSGEELQKFARRAGGILAFSGALICEEKNLLPIRVREFVTFCINLSVSMKYAGFCGFLTIS